MALLFSAFPLGSANERPQQETEGRKRMGCFFRLFPPHQVARVGYVNPRPRAPSTHLPPPGPVPSLSLPLVKAPHYC